MIGKGLTSNLLTYIDLTNFEVRKHLVLNESDIYIIGSPVYEGRVVNIVREVLKNIMGKNRYIIAVIVYGNKTIGIALKQLIELLELQQWKVIAGASFIGEHSFSKVTYPIAQGRPDKLDLELAYQFGQKAKVKYLEKSILNSSTILGKLPLLLRILPEGMASKTVKLPFVLDEKCTKCNLCVKICPTNCIDPITLLSKKDACIRCAACVKICPNKARDIEFKGKKLMQLWFRKAQYIRLEPTIYV